MKPFIDTSKSEPNKSNDNVYEDEELSFLLSNHQTILSNREYLDIDNYKLKKSSIIQDEEMHLNQSIHKNHLNDLISQKTYTDNILDNESTIIKGNFIKENDDIEFYESEEEIYYNENHLNNDTYELNDEDDDLKLDIYK